MSYIEVGEEFTLEIYPEQLEIQPKAEPLETIEIEDDSEDETRTEEVIVLDDDEEPAIPNRTIQPEAAKPNNTTPLINDNASNSNTKPPKIPPVSVLKPLKNGSFRCHLCRYLTNDRGFIVSHWSSNHQLQTFTCVECDAGFHTIEKLYHHFALEHDLQAPSKPRQTIMLDALPPPRGRKSTVKAAKPVPIPSSKTKENASKQNPIPDQSQNIPPPPPQPEEEVDLLRNMRIKKRVAHQPKSKNDNRIKVLDVVTIKPPTPQKKPRTDDPVTRKKPDKKRSDDVTTSKRRQSFDANPWDVNDVQVQEPNENHDNDDEDRLVIDEDFEAANNVSQLDVPQETVQVPSKQIPIYSPTRRCHKWVEFTFDELRRLRPSHVPNNEAYILKIVLTENENQSVEVEIPPDPPNYQDNRKN